MYSESLRTGELLSVQLNVLLFISEVSGEFQRCRGWQVNEFYRMKCWRAFKEQTWELSGELCKAQGFVLFRLFNSVDSWCSACNEALEVKKSLVQGCKYEVALLTVKIFFSLLITSGPLSVMSFSTYSFPLGSEVIPLKFWKKCCHVCVKSAKSVFLL